MFLLLRRLLFSAVTLLFVHNSFGCLKDLCLDKSIDFLSSQTPEQVAGHLNGMPELIQSQLKSALLKKCSDLYDNLIPYQSYELKGHTDWVSSVAFSSDGKFVVTGSNDKTARIWSLDTLESRELKGHTDCVTSVAFSPDGKFLLTNSKDKTARLWDVDTLKSREFKGHTGNIISIEFSSDSKLVLTLSDDKNTCIRTARIWDVETFKSHELKAHNHNVISTTFNTKGKLVLTCLGDNSIRLWDVDTLKYHELKGYTDNINVAEFKSDGKYVLLGFPKGILRLWDINTLKVHRFKPIRTPHNITSILSSPNGKLVVTRAGCRGYDGVRIWNTDTLESQELKVNTDNTDDTDSIITSITISSDSKLLLTGSFDGTVRIWNVDTLQSRELKKYANSMPSVAFSPDGKLALIKAAGSCVCISNLVTKDILNLEQLLFMRNFEHNKIDLTNTYSQKLLESLAPVIDGLPKLPSQSYHTHSLVKAYLDAKRAQLLKAAAHDDVATVEKLLSRGFGLNTCDKAGNNLWHYAFKGCIKGGVSYASKKVLELLVKLEGVEKGLKKNNKAGLPPFALGFMHNKDFTVNFLDIAPENSCSICLDDGDLKPTQCGHLFHDTCLSNWLKGHATCPNCRTEILPA
ncbi:hypothetical protein H0X48_06065 [Candidatus Dependentiae bacterium]|nr:hypothetical protein [Candidatus Dependentiae bacterium]